MAFFQKNKKLISVIIIFIIIALAIILPVYFLVIKKSSQSSELNSYPINKTTQSRILPTLDQSITDELGYCIIETINGVKQPKIFKLLKDFDNQQIVPLADTGDKLNNGIQYKWAYDITNPYYIARPVSNSKKNYTDDELHKLGGKYDYSSYLSLVNKIVPHIPTNTDQDYNTGLVLIDPIIVTTRSQCMK